MGGGNRIRELREQREMTQRELSRRSGVTERTLTRIENGQVTPRISTRRALLRALKAKPEEAFPRV